MMSERAPLSATQPKMHDQPTNLARNWPFVAPHAGQNMPKMLSKWLFGLAPACAPPAVGSTAPEVSPSSATFQSNYVEMCRNPPMSAPSWPFPAAPATIPKQNSVDSGASGDLGCSSCKRSSFSAKLGKLQSSFVCTHSVHRAPSFEAT